MSESYSKELPATAVLLNAELVIWKQDTLYVPL